MLNNNQPLFETKAVSKATEQLMSVQTEQTITSLEVAELTGKEHKNIIRDIRNILSQLDEIARHNFVVSEYKDAQNQVLRDIRNILPQMDENNRHNFVEISYTDSRNREQTCYRLTKEGCLCLVNI